MNKKIWLIGLISLLFLKHLSAQNVGIGTNTPNARAILELNSTNKGFLLPRVMLTGSNDNTTIPNAPFGLMIINEAEETAEGQGIYMQVSGPATPTWHKLGFEKSGWLTTGNYNGIGAKLGHMDNIPLQFIVNGNHVGRLGGNSNILFGLNSGANLPQNENLSAYNNIVIGNGAMITATTGTSNIAIGNSAMASANGGNTGIAIGGSALANQSNGASENIAIGFSSLVTTTTGSNNIGMGRQSLFGNTTGGDNIAIGFNALNNNKANSRSIAIGMYALDNADDRTSGRSTYNTAIGHYAMRGSSPASGNTARYSVAVGDSALARIGTGEGNVAIGFQALSSAGGANRNIGIGRRAGRGSGNFSGSIAIGDAALQSNIADFNIAVGDSAMSGAGSFGYANNNIGIGRKALQVASQTSNAIAIGHEAMSLTINASSIAIGNGALRNQRFGGRNTALGNGALFFLHSTENNIAIGDSALARIGQNTESGFQGSNNIGIGYKALYKNQLGRDNTIVGSEAMRNNTEGFENTVIGSFAMANNNTGSGNTMIGIAAGINNLSGSGNVFIGRAAGADESGSNRLYISNSNANRLTALIHGDFATPEVWINGRLKLKSGAANGIDLGYDLSKETNAGRIGYAITTPNTLDIYGAGTTNLNRAIKFWAEGGSNFTGSVNVDGFTRMGRSTESAPRVKMKKITATGPATNSTIAVTHGLTSSKILQVSVLMEFGAGPNETIPANYITTLGYQYEWQVRANDILIINRNNNSSNIGNRPVRILITYEE